MDFVSTPDPGRDVHTDSLAQLSRLIGANNTPNRKSNANNSPQQRLARFKKTYNQALVSSYMYWRR